MVVCPHCGEENPERARFCLACGQPLSVEALPGEERKVVSVLFVDLVGFTSQSDRADPEDVRATLRPYHERVKADIERFGGTVEKFIGDAVMAVFGAPVAHEDDAERAVRSALRILESIEELRSEGLEISVRAAVTTGEAVVALGARPERGEGIVTGDVVNTAARLQSAGPVGTVIVDEPTRRSTEATITFESLEPVAAKGKAEPIHVWRATHARSRVGEPEAATHTLFVGREHEQTMLFETFRRAERESAVQLVTVVGGPGIGKSRLVTELRTALDNRPDLITWRHGRCLPYGEGITFWALGEIVKAEAGILESDDQHVAASKLHETVAGLFVDESERAWLSARLGALVGAGSEVAAVGREEAFTAWRRFLEAMAARRPCVFVFEDVHWADGALLEFLEHVLDWGPPVPMLILCTARPEIFERSPSWGGGKRNATTISLAPLSAEETGRLLQVLLDRTLLPAETQTALLERAGGNPLYAEQFARMLVERGDVENLAVPETVHALVTARLDTLSPELKALLQDASVVGRVFWSGAVASMASRQPEDVRRDLNELARREFVRPVRVSSIDGEDEFSFWHTLVRDVAYQQIPRSPRAEKHLAAASWVEQTADDRLEDQAEILVYHYSEALELVQATGEERPEIVASLVRFLLLAGDRAMSLDIPAAEAAYRRALETMVESGQQRANVLVKLGDALQPLGRLVESVAAYEEAITALLAAGDERAAGLAMVHFGRALWRHGDTRRSREVSARAVALLESVRDSSLVLAYGRAAALDALGGKSEQAIEWANKGIELADEIGFENITRSLGMRGIARIDLGDPGGLDDMRAALDLALELGLPAEDTAIDYANVGEMESLENLARGRELLETGLEFARSRGHTHHVMVSRAYLLTHLFHEGRWDELLEEADALIQWDRERGATQIESWTTTDATMVLVHRGQTSNATTLISAALPRARDIGDPQTALPVIAIAALVAYARDDPGTADTLLSEYEARAAESSSYFDDELPVWLTIVALGLGDAARAEKFLSVHEPWTACGRSSLVHRRALVAEAAGHTEEAAQLFAEAAGGWRAWGSVPLRAYALIGLGNCAADPKALAEGLEIFAELGATPVFPSAASPRQQQV